MTVNRLCASGLEAVDPGRAPDPARRGGPRARRRRRVDDARAARDAEARARLPARRTASWSTPRSAGASSTRAWPSATRPSRWARRPRTSPSATASRARTRTRSRSSRTGARVAAAEAGRFDDEIVHGRRAAAEGRPGHGPRRRGPAPRHHARAPRQAAADLPRGRHRHRRQLVADQRRRGLRGAGERGARHASSAASRWRGIVSSASAGVDPAVHGHRPGARDAQGARARRPRAEGHRPGRAERGVRLAGARLDARARASTTTA